MRNINNIELKQGSKEEILPDLTLDFPYICSHVEIGKYRGLQVPWHWHKEVELFYLEKGTLEYNTPGGITVFTEGSGGLINSNVLHMTKTKEELSSSVLHIFDTSFISGQHGNLLEQKYVLPITTAPQIEIISLYPEYSEQAEILELLCKSFQLSQDDPVYEMKLRNMLSEIWCSLLWISEPLRKTKEHYNKSSDKIKWMLGYINEHYSEKITIAEIADAAYISERECFRTFRKSLNITPIEYLQDYRLQKACNMLTEGKESVAYISHACNMGSSSYFGKVFLEHMGCTPIEYRKKWQNIDIIGQK